MPRLNIGALVIGSMAGLGGILVIFAILSVAGVGDVLVVLLFLQYLAQLGAGFVAGRLGADRPVAHGTAAGLSLFLITAAISLAIATARPGVFTFLMGAIIASVLGAAGGTLAAHDLRGGGPAGRAVADPNGTGNRPEIGNGEPPE